jgi:hypothetical protein
MGIVGWIVLVLGCLLLSCASVLVAASVLYVCVSTPYCLYHDAVRLYQLLVQPWTLLCWLLLVDLLPGLFLCSVE